MVKKVGSKWVVGSKEGKYLGTYDTKQEAQRRLRQIEYFKYLRDQKDNNKAK
jgi:hypothetical protein